MTDDANAFLDAAFADRAAGRDDAAARRARQALALDPAAASGCYLLGATTGRPQWLRRALRLVPQSAAMKTHVALALMQMNRIAEAAVEIGRAAALTPGAPDATEADGLIRHSAGDYPGAIIRLLRAHVSRPQKTETLLSLGAAMRDARLFDAAETAYAAAVARRPDLREAWLGRAAVRLTRGDLPGGWADFEKRWKPAGDAPDGPKPAWDGRPLNGETLFIRAEQGFGDALQFARFVPFAADRGARVVLEAHPALVRLLRGLDPRIVVHPADAPPPPFDLHCPIMSLAGLFGAALNNLPPPPRLTPDPAEAARAAARVRAAGAALNVGLCWAGNPSHKNDRNRSLPPDALAALLTPLSAAPGIALWSLQTGDGRQGAYAPLNAVLSPPPLPLIDFAATAACIAALDAVVAVDTSVVHLAGTLGVPCRALLPYAPDWRWLVGRDDSPWYPSLRLIRQQRPGDWRDVAAKTAALLTGAAAERAARRENPSA